MNCVNSQLIHAAEKAERWLIEDAAPLWSERGRTSTGLFAERITLSCEPDPSYFRTFVQARHVFSFVTIGAMGWDGPWCDLVATTIDVLLERARRPDGLFVHRLDHRAAQLDARADLYDQAFILLALGSAGKALERPALYDEAERLLDCLEREWAHPSGGFREGEIVDDKVRRQNPHMHLLEAFLTLGENSGRERFERAAADIAGLATARFMDEHSGALLEYFEHDLSPAAGDAGRISEPGHCFEWAWLFERLSKRGDETRAVSERLVAFARRYGIDSTRGVAINEVLTDGTILNADARLWPQTERLKAAIGRFNRTGALNDATDAIAAAEGLAQYLDVPVRGLWRDKWREDRTWVDEPAPGSSLYHISCAYAELADLSCRLSSGIQV